jgi:hypothetical protein
LAIDDHLTERITPTIKTKNPIAPSISIVGAGVADRSEPLKSRKLCCGWERDSVRTLTEDQFRQEAEPQLERLFADYTTRCELERFAPTITQRQLVYPCHCGDFTEALPVKTLVAAAAAVGDEGCYLSSLFRSEGKPNHCFIPLAEMLIIHGDLRGEERHAALTSLNFSYAMSVYNLESVVYSPQGKWAIRMTHEHYGLMGGVPEFMAIIESGVPNLSQQVYDFFDRYRNWGSRKPHLHWVPPLLAHIYGPERAETLVAESKLDMTLHDYPPQAPQLLTEAELATERAIAAQKIIDLLTSGPTSPQP